jgi:hypothetical protein
MVARGRLGRSAVDHEEAGSPVKGGRGLLAVVLAALALVGAAGAARVGPASPASAAPGDAISGMWLCPHGGGPGWTGAIAIANPGTNTVAVRLTSIGSEAPSRPVSVEVPPGREVLQAVTAGERGSATFVEAFGGWVGVGWQVRAAGDESGMGAEPCAPSGGTTWFTADATTVRGQASYLVVMNPFEGEAVFDVTLYQPGRPPARPDDWTGVSLSPHRSIALEIAKQVVGRDPVAAQLVVTKGRVAAASLGVSKAGGVRSVLAASALSSTWYLPVGAGVGQSSLLVLVPQQADAGLNATLLSSQPAQPTAGLTDARQAGQSTASYDVLSSGAAAVVLHTDGDVPVLAALRSTGRGADGAATGGASTPGPAWLVMPTVAGNPPSPGLVIVNPGEASVDVTLRLLPEGPTDPGEPVTITVPAQQALAVPTTFLARDPKAAVMVSATGSIVALGASTSEGRHGLSDYGMSVGIPVPAVGLPGD